MGAHGFGHALLWYSIGSTLFYHATTLFYHVPLIITSSPALGMRRSLRAATGPDTTDR